MNEPNELIPIPPDKTDRIGETLPKVGEWYYVTTTEDWTHWREKDAEDRIVAKEGDEVLMCVGHVGSNYIELTWNYYDSHFSEKIMLYDLLGRIRPALDWKEKINGEMEQVRQLMQEATRQLHDAAIAANAISEKAEYSGDLSRDAMLPALRILDPVLQKRDLVALKDSLPAYKEKIDALAIRYSGLTKNLMKSEMSLMYLELSKLRVLEDKIFTIEIYAGLQESVMQIGDGEPAPIGSKITIRQTMLFMDEETMFDYDRGGLDYKRLKDFDRWVVQPRVLNRVLPEPRGVVAWRIRRDKKERGRAHSFAEMWGNMVEDQWNFTTYLLIRNGDRVYRIASEVDFSPRLIPYKDEFDDAFTETRGGDWAPTATDHSHRTPKEYVTITPNDFEYDKHRERIEERLKHYNRIVLLIQGLLDRSEVFHPHTSINMSDPAQFDQWVNLVRDDEDVIKDTSGETPEQFIQRINGWLEKGSLIYTNYVSIKQRQYVARRMPHFFRVEAVSPFNKSDLKQLEAAQAAAAREHRRAHGYSSSYHFYDTYAGSFKMPELGTVGIRVGWDNVLDKQWEGGYSTVRPTRNHEWLPMNKLINLDLYNKGDFKRFFYDRDQKARYREWAPLILTAERVKLGREQVEIIP